MRVVEIGCGELAGPYFEGAEQHIVSDISEEAVACTALQDSRFTQLVADASDISAVPDASVDIVLARNVFGDPHLGVGQRSFITSMVRGDVLVLEAIKQKKIAIMREAARMLLPTGKLVIVEEYSPMEAEDFIDDLGDDDHSVEGGITTPMPVRLRSVVPANYADYHERYDPRVWIARRAQQQTVGKQHA